jgi:hypothetical protein
MASRDEIEAATIRPPRRSECYQLAGTASTQVFQTPGDWFGKKVRFEAIGDDFWLQTGPDASISITPASTTTITGTTLNPAAASTGEKIANGAFKEFDFFQGVDLFVGVRATGTAGLLMLRMAEVSLGGT